MVTARQAEIIHVRLKAVFFISFLEKGYSLQELAKVTGITYSALMDFLHGNPSVKAKVFEILETKQKERCDGKDCQKLPG